MTDPSLETCTESKPGTIAQNSWTDQSSFKPEKRTIKLSIEGVSSVRSRNIIGSVLDYEEQKKANQAKRIRHQKRISNHNPNGRLRMPRKSVFIFNRGPVDDEASHSQRDKRKLSFLLPMASQAKDDSQGQPESVAN